MSYERMVLDHPDFTVEQDFHGKWVIRLSARCTGETLAIAGNNLLNKVYEIAQEVQKFSSTYVEPSSNTAQTVRPRGPMLKKKEKATEEEEPTSE